MKIKSLVICLLYLLFSQSLFAATATIISNPKVSFTDSQITFSYQVTSPQTTYRVYVDTTRNPTTGYYVGQIGAKYLIQNGNLYSYVGPGWKWKFVKGVAFSVTNNVATWKVGRTDMGNMNCAGAFDYAFQVVTGTITSAMPKMTLCYTANPSCVAPPEPRKQQVAVPAYFYPDCASNENCYWKQMLNAIPRVGLAVMNPNNGPGEQLDTQYAEQVKAMQDKEGIVLGYINANEGASGVDEMKKEVDRYFDWYQVNGIFFDNAYSQDCNRVDVYQSLTDYIKSKKSNAIVAMKYATDIQPCHMDQADLVVNFQGTYEQYLNWKPAKWVNEYDEVKFWHIVTSTELTNVENAVILAKMHKGGWVYVTPNADFSALPEMSYLDKELDSLN